LRRSPARWGNANEALATSRLVKSFNRRRELAVFGPSVAAPTLRSGIWESSGFASSGTSVTSHSLGSRSSRRERVVQHLDKGRAVEGVGLAFIPLDELLHLPADYPLCQVGIYWVPGVTRCARLWARPGGLRPITATLLCRVICFGCDKAPAREFSARTPRGEAIREAKRRRGRGPALWLSSLLVCSECGSNYVQYGRTDYVCSGFHNGSTCSNGMRFRIAEIEKAVL
jgi:Recombinase zinc beta ribbon domain